MPYTAPKMLNAGDEAIVVEFGNDISLTTNRQVHALAEAANRSAIEGIIGLVPSYRSVLVQFDPVANYTDRGVRGTWIAT